MPTLSAAREHNSAYAPTYIPTYVGVGATSGIGQAMVQAFASYTKGRAHIVIIGRNVAAAQSILEALPTPPPPIANTNAETTPVEYKREFISCDIRLMKNVHATSQKLTASLDKINFLVLTAGVLSFGSFNPTEEGIDDKLAVKYYSRWAFISDLLPLLKAAHGRGEHASVMSVLGGGFGPKIDVDDLGLKKTYNGIKATLSCATYNDLMIDEFAKREPDLAFTHIRPGFVDTGALSPVNPFLRVLYALFYPLLWLSTISQDVCADYMLYTLLDNKQGASIRNPKGEDIGVPKHGQIGGEAQDKLWEHTAVETGMNGR